MKKSEVASVLSATIALPDSARIALGRMAGVNMRSAMTSARGRNTVFTFMSLFSAELYDRISKHEKNILYFVCCTMCAQERNTGNALVHEYIGSIYNHPDTTDSEKDRIRAMISEDITATGNFLKHLSVYIKRGQRNGVDFNPYALANDLMSWNYGDQKSKAKWVRAMLKTEETGIEQEKPEEDKEKGEKNL